MESHGAQVGSREAFSHIERWKGNVAEPGLSLRLQHQELARHQRALAAAIPTPKGHRKTVPMDTGTSPMG